MKSHCLKILSHIKKEKAVTSSEIAALLGVSWNTSERHLMELAMEGKIERIKKKGVNVWLLK